jgi:hypothetical protein
MGLNSTEAVYIYIYIYIYKKTKSYPKRNFRYPSGRSIEDN